MWQRLGGYPKAIVERIHPGQGERGGRGGDPSLKRGKRVEAKGEKNPHATNIPLPLFDPVPTPLSPRGGFRVGSPIGGRTFLQRSLTKRS
ncbi:membrane protein [Lasius niger]|uniref:Membrane protein n=1 Tax=Lasius niger TaxID=67767 RepID=A0A0J7L6L6_LASNI|nr:membrane protein [Lasius niger]